LIKNVIVRRDQEAPGTGAGGERRMIWATLEYEWVDWEGNLIGHYSDGSDHMIKQNDTEAQP